MLYMTKKTHGFALILLLLTLQAACAAPPVKIIFDTDIGNDCDDAMALAVIHALQSRGQCDLLAVTVTKDSTLAAPFVDAINTFYGRGDIPIGVVHNGKTPNNGKFLKLAAQKDDGKLRYPHDLLDKSDAPEAVGLLRRTLAAQPDHSVIMIQVGFSTNLSRLLDSKPDDASPLTGVELVKKKTTLLSIMAGAFTPELIKKHFCEYNVKIDVPTAKHLIDTWPTDIVFSGWEIGNAIRYPAASIDNDYKYVAHHPIQEAYQLYVPTPHERPCYDLTSALYAVEPDGGYFGLSPRGRVIVEDDGFTRFEPDPDGPHRYLTVNSEQVEKTKAKLVELCIQPPQK